MDWRERLRSRIREVPDFPKPGILFRDISPLVRDPEALRIAVHHLIHPFVGQPVDLVVGMEARGFIFGCLAAWELGVGFVPLRKPGKLPYDVQAISYDLEYGAAQLEVQIDAIRPGERVVIVDDLLATGGTAEASCRLVEQLGARVFGLAFAIELKELGGRARLKGRFVHSLLQL